MIEVIRERKTCPCCGQVVVFEIAIIKCDNCGKVIKSSNEESELYLEMTVFLDRGSCIDERYKQLHFCSWKCVREYLSKFEPPKNFNFISLPFLHREHIEEFKKEFIKKGS